jgi:hypothetical protein
MIDFERFTRRQSTFGRILRHKSDGSTGKKLLNPAKADRAVFALIFL